MNLYDEKRTFRVITPDKSFEVEDYEPIEELLNILQRDRQGFVRLEMMPPLNGMCYWETCFNPKTRVFLLVFWRNGKMDRAFGSVEAAGWKSIGIAV